MGVHPPEYLPQCRFAAVVWRCSAFALPMESTARGWERVRPGKAILIAGYPGSGKTTYGNTLKNTNGAAEYVDDYHANAIGDDPAFARGRKYGEMTAGLRWGETWLASDTEWCRPQSRRAVKADLRAAVPDVAIE